MTAMRMGKVSRARQISLTPAFPAVQLVLGIRHYNMFPPTPTTWQHCPKINGGRFPEERKKGKKKKGKKKWMGLKKRYTVGFPPNPLFFIHSLAGNLGVAFYSAFFLDLGPYENSDGK